MDKRLEKEKRDHNEQIDTYLYIYLYFFLLINRELVVEKQMPMIISSSDEEKKQLPYTQQCPEWHQATVQQSLSSPSPLRETQNHYHESITIAFNYITTADTVHAAV